MRIDAMKDRSYMGRIVPGLMRRAAVWLTGMPVCAGLAVLVAALLLTCCIKEDAGSCGSVGGPDGDVTVGFRPGTLIIAGPSGADDGWGTSSTGARSASTRAGVPPTGMVEGAFQIGDLWVDGNRGSTQEKLMTWAEATVYCRSLGLRLPNYEEMESIVSYVVKNSPLPDNAKFEFKPEGTWSQYYYWTSTPRDADASYVWVGYLYPSSAYMDGVPADDNEMVSARCVKREGEEILPPAPDPGPDVENPDGLPVGTTFRVVVYAAGADPQSDSPVDQNTYKIADTKGTIVASAVDEFGNATDDAARELVLRRGAYDFYYFSPAVPASTSMPNPGRYTGLTNGADYMALAHREVIDPSQGPKHYIPEVCFYRMGSYIDVRISPREGEIMGTLEVTGDGLQLWGLPGSARYEIGDYPYRLITEGSGGTVEFAPANFAAEEGKTATVSTLGTGGGRAVLPGYARDLRVEVTLTSDGKEMKLGASLAGYIFSPGYRYVVELGVGRIADKPELSIEILPWNEYDWGKGTLGGNWASVGALYGGGVVYWVNSDDASDFRVVARDMTSSLAWSSSAVQSVILASNEESVSDGAKMWQLAKAYSDARLEGATGNFATDFPAFAYCYDYQGPDGADPKGTWFLPATIEMGWLRGVQDNIDVVLKANGWTGIAKGWYWTATQNETEDADDHPGDGTVQAWRQNFADLYSSPYLKTTGYYVRCVRRSKSELDGDVISAAIIPDPSGGFSADGKAFSVVMLGGHLGSGVTVQARIDGQTTALASATATTTGTGVVLKVPANGYPNPARTIVFGYVEGGTFKEIDRGMQAAGKNPIDTGGGGTVIEPDRGMQVPWLQAIDYCRGMGDGWRLPTENELMYYWCVGPSIPADSKFSGDSYWSATDYYERVWYVSFTFGYTWLNEKTANSYVRCVREQAQSGVKYPYVTTASDGGVVVVLRDDNGGIDEASLFSSRVTESKTGYERSTDNRMSRKFRVQKAQSQSSTVTWSDAVSYCDNLTEEGYSDWRLPSQRELMMIWILGGNSNVASGEKNKTGVGSASVPVNTPYIYQQSGFTAFSTYPYWTATDYNTELKWFVAVQNGNTGTHSTATSNYVRCVRDEW